MVSGWKTAAYQKLTQFSGTTQSEEKVYLGKISFRENASLEPCCWLKERERQLEVEGANACLLMRAALKLRLNRCYSSGKQQERLMTKDRILDIAPAAGPHKQQRASDFHRAWGGMA